MMIDMLMDVIILEIMMVGMKVRTPALITDFHIIAVYNAVPHQLLTKIFYEQVWDSFGGFCCCRHCFKVRFLKYFHLREIIKVRRVCRYLWIICRIEKNVFKKCSRFFIMGHVIYFLQIAKFILNAFKSIQYNFQFTFQHSGHNCKCPCLN